MSEGSNQQEDAATKKRKRPEEDVIDFSKNDGSENDDIVQEDFLDLTCESDG